MDINRPGIGIGYDLIRKGKFKTILILIAIFFILGVIMIFKGIGDVQTYNELKEQNTIVTAKLYSPNRVAQDGSKYSTKYYEWYYNGKYYSSKISTFDGKTQKNPEGTEYELYIDSQNPETYARVTQDVPVSSGVILGVILIGLSVVCGAPVLILMRKSKK